MSDLVSVKSSNIAAIGFDEAQRIIEVEFLSGSLYLYLDCDRELFEEFMAAESKGKFLNSHIKKFKEFVKVGE